MSGAYQQRGSGAYEQLGSNVYRQLRERTPRTAELLAYRDVLTERYLRPAAGSSVGPLSVALGDSLPDVGDEASGISGFAVGQFDDDAPPALYIFTREAESGAQELLQRLESANFPCHLVPDVNFVAASRPTKGGESIGYGTSGGASGTMGCVVKDRSDGTCYALSCNHVIANLNHALRGVTDVWAPGTNRRGTSRDKLGVVHDFEDIDFSPGAFNVIDAALARPDNAADIDPAISGVGPIRGTNFGLRRGDRVKKVGANTGLTFGKHRFDINADIKYADGSLAVFRNLLGIVGLTNGTNFAAQEDSGAIVLDDTDAAAAQVISVSEGIDLTLATRIEHIVGHFKVDIV